jgi:PAS domain S-box-containing protein
MADFHWTELFEAASYGYSPVAGPIAAVGLLSLFIGLWVVIRERGRPVAVSFQATTLALSVYLGGFALMAQSVNPDVALFWGRIAYYGVPFIVPGIFHFTIHLLGRQRKRAKLLQAAWSVGVVYWVLAVYTDLLVAGVRATSWGYVTRITLWNVPVILWSTFLLGVLVRDLIREHAEADPVQKARIRWFAIPLMIGCLGFADYGPSFGLPGLPVGFAFFPVFLLSAAWAVARYHLPDLTPAFAADHIIATMAEPLLVCDVTGRVAIANDAACRLLGYPKDELVHGRLSMLFGPAQTRAVLGAVMQEREMAIYARSGERIAVAVSTSRLLDKQGHRIATVVVARDIRERKRAAEALRRREEHYRALIENALDTITILDGEGRISYQSPAVREVRGSRRCSATSWTIQARPPRARPGSGTPGVATACSSCAGPTCWRTPRCAAWCSTVATSPRSASWPSSCTTRRRWRPSAGSRVAWPTTSTTS